MGLQYCADVEGLEALVVRASRGDVEAWTALWEVVEPILLRLVGQPRFLGRVGQQIDDRRNIVVEVMARLSADQFRRLAAYVALRRANPDMQFETWLRVVTKRVGIDYLRGHPNYIDQRRNADASRPGVWIDPSTLPPASELGGARPPVTNLGTANELLRHAAAVLPPMHLLALELWLQSESYDAIARAVGFTSATEAERIIRAAIERLRRKYREEGSR